MYKFFSIKKFIYLYLFKVIFIFYSIIIVFKKSFNSKKILIIDTDNQLSQYENNIDFSKYNTDIKPIALYLPQYYPIKENDEFWGKGSPEWTNAKKGKPHFKGHHQPRMPGDKINYLDYYQLNSSNVIKKQIQLANSHGIYGFGIYYYWFSGRRLLEKPLDIYLNDKNLNFPFMLIRANHNWIRKWDGRIKEVLINQEYKDGDPELFIKDIKKYIFDNRYIKIKNKPVIGIFEPFKIPKLNETLIIWREKSKEYGIGEIFILICVNGHNINKIQNLGLFDGAYDFPPKNNLVKYRNKFRKTILYNELI